MVGGGCPQTEPAVLSTNTSSAYSQRNRPIRCRGQEPPRVTGGGDSFDRAGTAEPDRDADRRAISDPPPSVGCTVDRGACRLERLQAAGRVGAVRRLGAGDHLATHHEARRTRGEYHTDPPLAVPVNESPGVSSVATTA